MDFRKHLKELRKLDEVVGTDVCEIIMDMRCRIEKLEEQSKTQRKSLSFHDRLIPWLWYVALVFSVVGILLHFL